MKKSTLSFVIATVIAPIANNSHAALVTVSQMDTFSSNNGGYLITGEDGQDYNIDNLQTAVRNATTLNQDHEVRIYALEGQAAGKADQTALDKEISARKQDISSLDFAIQGKASQFVYDLDKQDQQKLDADQNTAINAKADKTELTTEATRAGAAEGVNASGIAANQTAIQAEATRAAAAEGVNASGIAANSQQIAANKSDLNNEVIRATGADAQQAAAIATNSVELGDHENRLVEMKKDVNRNTAGISDHETRITTLESAPKPTNGIDGKDGAKGDKGDAGAAGLNGVDGKDGANGKDADMSKVNANARGVADNKTAISLNATAIQTESKTEAQHFNVLAQGVDHAQASGEYAQSRADVAYANAQANRQAMNATNQRVAANSAELADHENRITELEQDNSANFGKLKNEVDNNRKRASAGIAGVAAMANIPQVIQGQTFSVGAGVGTADSEQALAVGLSARATENAVVKASVSNDSRHNFVAGAGVSYGW